MSFQNLRLNKPILKAVDAANFDTATLVQEQTIPLVLAKKDVIVSAQTGTGKTAAFALPILQLLYDKQDASKKGRKIRALVVSPTRELALQIENDFKAFGRYTNLRTGVVFWWNIDRTTKRYSKKRLGYISCHSWSAIRSLQAGLY